MAVPPAAATIARTLRDAGVRHAFGLPGGEVIDLIAALEGAGIEFVLVGHESSAAIMAEVTAQLTGTPGVCVGTVGPGAANLVPGVAHAWLDRGPVLAFTGALPTGAAGTYTHQALDQGAMFAPVTKWTATLTGGPQETVRRAIRLACSGRPGPVHLDLPTDMALREAAFDPHLPPVPALRGAGAPDGAAAPGPPGGRVAAALSLLAASRRPALVVGLGCLWDEVATEVRDLAHRLGAPVLTTPKAKGVMPESDPLFLGVAGLGMKADGALKQVLAEADLVVAVGFEPVEVVRSWYRPWPTSTPAVHVDRLPNADEYYRADAELLGNVRASLAALLAHLPGTGRQPWDDWPAARARLLADLHPASGGEAGGPLSPARVIAAVRDALPAEAIGVVDVGSHKILAAQLWRTEQPHGFLVSNGLSLMGYGVPAAIAAKLNRPDQPVAAILGDGGFAMAMQEVAVAARHRLNVVLVVFADQALSLIKLKQLGRSLPPVGVDFHGMDHAAAAEAMGGRGMRVGRLAELPGAVAAALEHRGPVVVDVAVDPAEYRMQM